MSGLRLMAIHAHPDDESSKGAATMARYAAEGNQVMVVTCTGGERGDILNPAMDKPGILDNIFAVRQEEMAKAMEILGTEHRWLGYEDSGLPQGDPLPPLPEGCFALEDSDKVTRDLVKILREFRPHVLITYDENGGYPHPDHLKVHEVSMLAWEKSGDAAYAPELGAPWEPLKLYYTHGFIRQRMEMFHDLLIEQGKPSPYTPMLERWKANEADVMARVTTQVPCERFFDQRDDALRAHATQIDPAGAFFGTPVEVQRRLWPTEEFELAKTRVKTSIPEDDLFAGITPDAE
ncbi:mycothiol conjugate amidase Mca [Corynebacterium glutamicum]|uniref:Mycothiol S-conjugate amidase n=1 Tax=Corynebacterium glutamicum TaxID=1718 RepID=A0AB36ICF9_CORGT|nr:mycothiol conjugate amidase Mca [Corynebacterium glutamicum]AGN18735.1 mycothiol conjugate amidase Mca [Corynebacterium glutamicum SCgG1]AGN21758.1 mycothiol conjugate amidase Mca [Corynebacterium glutamicum SCgG2]EOA65134.1 mycothiol conjugate amidase Mca [Corynebacterium glutamicum MT]EPP41088.1 mycothiol conjugate amidase Mca [Corynebacterium glutamicum Z188]NII87788.1 mycothiol S-conjugate amidase [Corynebacterium glutamicum]